MKIVIIGAGPCGLGAGFRLKELGQENFEIFDVLDRPGGLATSYTDGKGYTWDLGVHIQYSHYEDFDRVMDLALPDGWTSYHRETWVWLQNDFHPYPFQYNLRRLKPEQIQKCINDLESPRSMTVLKNFEDWMVASFGEGLTDLFMRPYNFKVWAHPAEMMSYQWIGERVATVDVERLKKNLSESRDDGSWGPNARFRFPTRGSTGVVWKNVASLVGSEKVHLRHQVRNIQPERRRLVVRDLNNQKDREVKYDVLLSAIPLNQLARLCGLSVKGDFLAADVHIVGLGLKGQCPEHLRKKTWIYYSESQYNFFRVTCLSNYSPSNVPDPQNNWSLLFEISSSTYKAARMESIIADTVAAAIDAGLIESESQIDSVWKHLASPGYPVPFLNRDQIVHSLLDQLKVFEIYSRGRFGAWKYEVSNQDHTFMQGFEWAENLVRGTPEMTAFSPHLANAPGKRPLFKT